MIFFITILLSLLPFIRSDQFPIKRLVSNIEARASNASIDSYSISLVIKRIRSVAPILIEKYTKKALENPLEIQDYAQSASIELSQSIESLAFDQRISKRQTSACPGIKFLKLLVTVVGIVGVSAFGVFVVYLREIAAKKYCLTHKCTSDPNDYNEIKDNDTYVYYQELYKVE